MIRFSKIGYCISGVLCLGFPSSKHQNDMGADCVFEANLKKYLDDFRLDILSDNESSVNRIISKHHFNTIFNYTLSNGMLNNSSEKTVLDANLDNYWKP